MVFVADEYIETILTRRHTKETKTKPGIYTILPSSTDFDFLGESAYFKIRFRIVRFQLEDGSYTCVATNLPEDEIPLEEIKRLYRLRWGEETSFRQLKYTIGLVNFHSRKKEFNIQEVYARMILYNFCELAIRHATVSTKKHTKHIYQMNFATAVKYMPGIPEIWR